MIRVITTPHLIYSVLSGLVMARTTGEILGFIWEGPLLPVDFDIIGEWADLQAWEIADMSELEANF